MVGLKCLSVRSSLRVKKQRDKGSSKHLQICLFVLGARRVGFTTMGSSVTARRIKKKDNLVFSVMDDAWLMLCGADWLHFTHLVFQVCTDPSNYLLSLKTKKGANPSQSTLSALILLIL